MIINSEKRSPAIAAARGGVRAWSVRVGRSIIYDLSVRWIPDSLATLTAQSIREIARAIFIQRWILRLEKALERV
jgi:hypothetical protein